MQYLILAILFLITFGASASVKYTNRYDTIDLETILVNRRLLVPYIKCVLEQGKCSPEGRELKSHIKEALQNHCAKCTAMQQVGIGRVFNHLMNKEPAYWQQLVAKYDPEHKYLTKYKDELIVKH